MDELTLVLDRLTGPLEFARRESGKARDTVKNLGAFVSRQVVAALAAGVHPSAVEADLLALRQLFSDYDGCRDPRERRRRLKEADAVLDRLRQPGRGASGACVVPGASDEMIPLRPPPRDLWTLSIQYARGVGPARAALLGKLGIRSVEDALWYVPWRYEDRSAIVPIDQLTPGMKGTVCGAVVECTVSRTARRNLTLTRVTVADQSGTIQAVFFNQPYLEKLLKTETRVMLSGLAAVGRSGWPSLQLETPQYEILGEEWELPIHVGRIVPIYHETKGLSSRQMRAIVKSLLDQYQPDLVEVLPDGIRTRHRLPTLLEAVPEVHFPAPGTDPEQLAHGLTPAHRRLAFEELFLLELALGLRHRTVKEEPKEFHVDISTPLTARLRKQLRFQLTGAQERVLREITGDLASPHPMNRLLQGDVGCGKSIVALHAMLLACGSGYQAALMAPTEILAEQHYLNLRELLHPLDIPIVLLRGGGSLKSRQAILGEIEQGKAQIIVGTHALIQKDVHFAQLALVVIDEQHKFGVLQRKMLLEKGYRPDVLVMTATPIPRTLAMTVYGDLDVSVIDELPAGRKPVRTCLFTATQRRRAYQIIKDEVGLGRQAYVVYPLVEESEKVDLQAAQQAAERLQKNEFREFRVGLLHGRMKSAEKEHVMADFKRGRIQVLVATTVIEVGVDVPNATVIVVDHAERFGLAQLHQLRGRVGRGAQQAYCLLVTSSSRGGALAGSANQRNPSRERLEALVKSTDGFVIAEEDLRIRGPGEFFGVRQWGVPEFRAANLIRDARLLEEARAAAQLLLAKDPRLMIAAHRPARAAMLRRWQTKLDLGGIS